MLYGSFLFFVGLNFFRKIMAIVCVETVFILYWKQKEKNRERERSIDCLICGVGGLLASDWLIWKSSHVIGETGFVRNQWPAAVSLHVDAVNRRRNAPQLLVCNRINFVGERKNAEKPFSSSFFDWISSFAIFLTPFLPDKYNYIPLRIMTVWLCLLWARFTCVKNQRIVRQLRSRSFSLGDFRRRIADCLICFFRGVFFFATTELIIRIFTDIMA